MNIRPFKIRDVEIDPPLVLSPMAGVTDISFRRL
jgi:tRNA-dihydrouridine synthase